MEGVEVIRRLSVMLVALALVAVACGDDSGNAVFTSTTSRPNGGGTTYPPAIVEEYVAGCAAEAAEALCRCTIEEFQQRLTLAEFTDLIDTNVETDPLVQEVVAICIRRGLSDTTTTTAPGAATTATTPDFVPITDIETITNLTIVDLEQWWATELPAVFGVEYDTVSAFGAYFPSRGDVPSCGGPLKRDEFEENAFYCSINDTVQWDAEGLMAPLFQEFGDFTVALVLAHEWGHAVQTRFGFDDLRQPTIVSELQADCLAGSWTGRVFREESDVLRLEPGDLEEGMAGFLLIGDQLGTSPGGSNSHGGSFDRLNAFFEGFNEGTSQCATYETVQPVVVFIPLRVGEDPVEGGDLPYEETAPLLGDALEAFWAIVYPEVFGTEWIPVSTRIAYRPSTGQVPSCGGRTLDSDFYAGNAFYCPQDDFVAWDDEGLFPSLYQEIGDFALGLVLANEWGRAVQARAGLPTDTPAAQLQVDCLTGVWTAALVPEDNPTGILLSAGDLEEGIASFLQLSTDAGDERSVSAFDRFESFKEGFFDGTGACGL